MTMASLRVFVFLLGLVALSHSCGFKKLKFKFENGKFVLPKGCYDDDGILHKYGESWKKDCNEFKCIKNFGTSCIPRIPAPSTLNIPPNCEMLVNRKTCSFKLVEKANNSKKCNI